MRETEVPCSKRARALAERLHAGQVDRCGTPYVAHLGAVVGILTSKWPDAPLAAVEAAWLHDALEDTEATPQDLAAAGVSVEAISIIRAVTRPAGTTYRQWIADLAASANTWAIRVKLADNEHNSDPARRLPGSDIVRDRYLPARHTLEKALTNG